MQETASTVEAPGGGLPPAEGEPSLWQRYGVVAVFLAPALLLLGVWVVYPTVSTIIRSFYDRSGDEFIGLDNYETLFTRRDAADRDPQQLPLAPRRPGVRDGGRARVRRSPGADPLLDRLQGRRLHADGDLALRRRRDLAVHVREGPEPGHDQRGDRGGEGRRQPGGRALVGASLDRRAHRRPGGRPRAAGAARAGRRRAARADRDPDVGRPRGRRAGRRPGGARRRHHRGRVAGLQAGRRDAGRGRGRGARAPRGHGRAPAGVGRRCRRDDGDRGGRHLRLRGGRGRRPVPRRDRAGHVLAALRGRLVARAEPHHARRS